MRIYDTLKKKKVELVPIKDREIGIYLCGPTVYDYGHLGHGRSAVIFDLLRRYLIYRGYKVTFVRNWTDIDDKTIDRAQRENITVKELTEKFIRIYREDFARLNILEPDFDPKPTEHIPMIVEFVQRLVERGHAYVADDGVYFDISSFPEYGSLSGQSLEDLRTGARVEVSEHKKNPGDFVLWKFEKPGEPSWPSPWGKGRPGWHIECSVMSVQYLGEEFDIHCGGQDLIFPHHEDEIAQSKGAGFRFARHWLHNAFLNINNEKMSKSLGNFLTLQEVFKKYPPLAVRFFLISAHYRAPLNFSEESLEQAKNSLERFNDFILRVSEIAKKSIKGDRIISSETRLQAFTSVDELVRAARVEFEAGLDDDLNVSRALGALSVFMREINTMMDAGTLSREGAQRVIDFMTDVNKVLGVFSFERELPRGDIERLIEERNEARRQRDFQRADEIRKQLWERGIILEDTREGTRWKSR